MGAPKIILAFYGDRGARCFVGTAQHFVACDTAVSIATFIDSARELVATVPAAEGRSSIPVATGWKGGPMKLLLVNLEACLGMRAGVR